MASFDGGKRDQSHQHGPGALLTISSSYFPSQLRLLNRDYDLLRFAESCPVS